MKKTKMILFGLLVSLITVTAQAQNSKLTVNITDFKNNKGACRIWLYNSAVGFLKEKEALQCVEAVIAGNSSHYVFNNLPTGTYAVSVCHDENGNHKFDTNFLGIPKEAYGNSNGARGGIGGPPKFKDASFILGKADYVVTIKVQ